VSERVTEETTEQAGAVATLCPCIPQAAISNLALITGYKTMLIVFFLIFSVGTEFSDTLLLPSSKLL
jgi:hypothetical protein